MAGVTSGAFRIIREEQQEVETPFRSTRTARRASCLLTRFDLQNRVRNIRASAVIMPSIRLYNASTRDSAPISYARKDNENKQTVSFRFTEHHYIP